jgi:hypothetical protein
MFLPITLKKKLLRLFYIFSGGKRKPEIFLQLSMKDVVWPSAGILDHIEIYKLGEESVM